MISAFRGVSPQRSVNDDVRTRRHCRKRQGRPCRLEAGAELLADGPALNGNRKPIVQVAITADSELMISRLDRQIGKGVNPTSTPSILTRAPVIFSVSILTSPVICAYQTGGFATAHCPRSAGSLYHSNPHSSASSGRYHCAIDSGAQAAERSRR